MYTPELVLDGAEVRRGALDALKGGVQSASPIIELEVRTTGDAIDVKTRVSGAAAGSKVYLALSEDGLSVDVARGENAGKTLRHEAVVRALLGPLPLGGAAQRITLPSSAYGKLNIVAFVEAASSTAIVQAVSAPVR